MAGQVGICGCHKVGAEWMECDAIAEKADEDAGQESHQVVSNEL